MEELLHFMQASNGAFKSELMKSFIAKHKGEGYPQAPPMPIPAGYNQNTGASLFSPPSTSPATTTTPSPPATTPGTDATTDNANILMQKMTLTDNHQTSSSSVSTTDTAANNTANVMDNQNSASPVIMETNGNGLNANLNRNLTAATAKTSAPQQQQQQQHLHQQEQPASPTEPDTNANISEVNAVLEEVRGALTETQQLLMAEVTEATVDAHLATCLNTHQAVRDATARFMALKEAGQLPDMSKMCQSAGSMWHKMTEQMMPEMGRTVRFFRLLPGFNELCQMDQIKLIKQGMFEIMMTRFAMLIDVANDTMLDPSHKMVCPRQVVTQMPMGKFLAGFFHVGAQFNPLGLTDGEIGLFTAVLAFCPSRPGLQDIQLVSAIQSLYQKALFQLIKRNHSDAVSKFSRALSLVPMFHRMSEEHDKALAAMQMQSPDSYTQQFSPLHREFYPTAKQEAQ